MKKVILFGTLCSFCFFGHSEAMNNVPQTGNKDQLPAAKLPTVRVAAIQAGRGVGRIVASSKFKTVGNVRKQLFQTNDHLQNVQQESDEQHVVSQDILDLSSSQLQIQVPKSIEAEPINQVAEDSLQGTEGAEVNTEVNNSQTNQLQGQQLNTNPDQTVDQADIKDSSENKADIKDSSEKKDDQTVCKSPESAPVQVNEVETVTPLVVEAQINQVAADSLQGTEGAGANTGNSQINQHSENLNSQRNSIDSITTASQLQQNVDMSQFAVDNSQNGLSLAHVPLSTGASAVDSIAENAQEPQTNPPQGQQLNTNPDQTIIVDQADIKDSSENKADIKDSSEKKKKDKKNDQAALKSPKDVSAQAHDVKTVAPHVAVPSKVPASAPKRGIFTKK